MDSIKLSFLQGFIKECVARNVNPAVVIKAAVDMPVFDSLDRVKSAMALPFIKSAQQVDWNAVRRQNSAYDPVGNWFRGIGRSINRTFAAPTQNIRNRYASQESTALAENAREHAYDKWRTPSSSTQYAQNWAKRNPGRVGVVNGNNIMQNIPEAPSAPQYAGKTIGAQMAEYKRDVARNPQAMAAKGVGYGDDARSRQLAQKPVTQPKPVSTPPPAPVSAAPVSASPNIAAKPTTAPVQPASQGLRHTGIYQGGQEVMGNKGGGLNEQSRVSALAAERAGVGGAPTTGTGVLASNQLRPGQVSMPNSVPTAANRWIAQNTPKQPDVTANTQAFMNNKLKQDYARNSQHTRNSISFTPLAGSSRGNVRRLGA